MSNTGITRRHAMLIGGAMPAIIALPALAQAQAQAPAGKEAAMARTHTVRLGSFEVTTLLGGAGMREKPIETFGIGAEPAEFEELSAANFIPADRSGQSFTLTLVKTPDALVLFDTGMVPDVNKAALAAAGYTPEDITHVVLTHMHGDHVSGLMQDGNPVFAKAQLIAPKDENDHWAANPSEAYTTHVAPLIDKATLIADKDEVMPGITAAAAHGHTPGHTTYLLESDGQRLLITGDSFNHYVYSVQRPDWHVSFDVDKEQGAATRRTVLAHLAEERIPFIGYHMPFPALAFIAAGETEGSFRYVPATYQFAG